jgi:hypothetical protein
LPDVKKKVWHIHGDAATPDSVIMGHYYYGKLLREIQLRIKIFMPFCKGCMNNGVDSESKSWVDLFLTKDVYIVGFGFDFSEMDLWWLAACKKKEFANTKIHYYAPKGETNMKKMPATLPAYKIERSELAPFAVRWEEIMGWFLVPKLGEKLSWAMYDFPEKKRTELCEMEVVGKAEVHGIEGVEIVAVETDPMGCNSAGGQKKVERRFVAQLTDSHCRLLAESHEENGVKRYYTFLDGENFLANWGFGEDNCGNEIHISPKGDITREGNAIAAKEKEFLLDVVGRYNVTIGGKTYDTVCIVDCYTYIDGAMSEQYVDQNGRTILWRRFNRNDWAYSRYGKLWTEMLPENETLTVNGETYVHWYDCITDYIL